MRLAEYDGKVLLRRHGIAVPRGVLVHAGESPPDSVANWPGFVLKAQILEGGRGKRGLVRVFDTLDGFRDARRLILPHPSGKGKIDVTAPLPPHMRVTWKYFGFDEKNDGDPFAEIAS